MSSVPSNAPQTPMTASTQRSLQQTPSTTGTNTTLSGARTSTLQRNLASLVDNADQWAEGSDFETNCFRRFANTLTGKISSHLSSRLSLNDDAASLKPCETTTSFKTIMRRIESEATLERSRSGAGADVNVPGDDANVVGSSLNLAALKRVHTSPGELGHRREFDDYSRLAMAFGGN